MCRKTCEARNQKQCILRGTAIPAGPILPITSYHKHTSPPIHVVQKITIIRVQKIEKSAAPSGGAEKKLNMGAQLQTVAYIQSLQNLFL